MRVKYYKDKIKSLDLKLKRLSQKSLKYSFARLFLLIIGIFIIYLAFSISGTWGIVAILLVIAIFLTIVKLHSKINKQKEYTANLIKVYTNELELKVKGNIFGNGSKYIDRNHNYSNDLDVFGKFSLFNLINRTVTHEGETLLAHWLKEPMFNREKILNRHEILKELSKINGFKEKFLSAGFLSKKTKEESENIKIWIENFKYFFIKKKYLKPILYAFSTSLTILLLLGFYNPVFWNYSIINIGINYILMSMYLKNVNRLHGFISKQEKLFYKYSLLIKYIANEDFKNIDLLDLQNKIKGKNHIEDQFKAISRLIKKLDYRLNIIVSIFLNLIFFWDIHISYAIEKWMKKNQNSIDVWLNIVGEFDALLSLSILHFNNPEWSWPEIKQGNIFIEAKGIGHPMIEKTLRIDNDYKISGKGKFDIVTGSNMAGKSTFLRAIGLNSILALSGCPVCANLFVISPIKVLTFMRINDSLEDNLSSFHAELERIKSILNFVKNNENCFLLMDEILRGTNSEDRYIGSVALIKQLIKLNASGIIATHDLKLTKLAEELPENVRNFNFSVKTKGEDLFFDYKLDTGVCDSFNASILMKKIGIEMDIIS